MSETMDLISVIIPTFNAENYVAATLDSVLAQTDPRFEVIVVDDGSTDGTREILRRYQTRVRVIEQPNRGPAEARNRLLHEAAGRLVAFLDADDLWLPTKLARQRELFRRFPDLVLAAGQLRHVDAVGRPIEMKAEPHFAPFLDKLQDMHRPLLQVGNLIAQSSVLAAREHVLAVGGWYSQQRILSTDYDLWIRLAQRGPFFISSEFVGDYRVLERSLSHGSVSREYTGQLRILEMHRHHFTETEFRRRLSRLYYDWAESSFVKQEPDAWTVIRQALAMNLFNLDAWRLAVKRALATPWRWAGLHR